MAGGTNTLTTTFDFTGKKAVATGAGGAIGGEIARGLAKAGAQVAIWDISLDAARATALLRRALVITTIAETLMTMLWAEIRWKACDVGTAQGTCGKVL